MDGADLCAPDFADNPPPQSLADRTTASFPLFLPTAVTYRSLLFLGAAALVSLSACDSGDAIDAPTPADVAGIYDIGAFRFVPQASALRPVNVADTLVVADSFVRLFDGGQATLEFRRKGGTARFVPGTFEIRRRELRITFSGGNGETLGRLLLPQVLTFARDSETGALAFEETLTADLEAYDSARYGGFRSVPGVLSLQIAPRSGT